MSSTIPHFLCWVICPASHEIIRPDDIYYSYKNREPILNEKTNSMCIDAYVEPQFCTT